MIVAHKLGSFQNGMLSITCGGKSKIQWIFFPHFFIERFHAGDEVKNKHLTFSYKRQGILSGMLKTHKLTQKINTKLSSSYYTLAI